MNGLILDAGNTRTKLFRWRGGCAPPVYAGKLPAAPEELGQWESPRPGDSPDQVADLVAGRVAAFPGAPLVLTSVLPPLQEALQERLPEIRVVDHHLALPFELAVEEPAAVGADRLCNVAAAAAAGLRGALVVDVGTAVTFDVLVDGVFLGGLIAPGPGFSLGQLAARAARLGEVPLTPRPLVAGASTAEAMMAGAWHMARAGIRGCVDGLCRHHGPLPVVVTGGLGHHFVAEDWFLDPFFTLRGAAYLGRLFS